MGFDDEGKIAIVEEDIEDDEDDGLELHKRVCYLIPIIFFAINQHYVIFIRKRRLNVHKTFKYGKTNELL